MNDMEYRYFYEVAKTLNFNHAAENLFISQPALSRCILKIEQEFGTQLFVRTKRSVQLTDAGIALLNHYPLVQKASHELYEKVQNAANGLNSRLTIGIQDGHLITPKLKELLESFRKTANGIQIDVVSIPYINLSDQLNDHTIDIALSLEFPNNVYSNISHKVIERRKSYALVSKNHPAAKAEDPKEQLALLDGTDLLMVKWSIVPNVTSYIINQCNANGFVPANVHYASSYLTLYNWLIMEKGFSIMDKGSIFDETVLACIPLQDAREINFCAYWNNEIINTAVPHFIEHVNKYTEMLK